MYVVREETDVVLKATPFNLQGCGLQIPKQSSQLRYEGWGVNVVIALPGSMANQVDIKLRWSSINKLCHLFWQTQVTNSHSPNSGRFSLVPNCIFARSAHSISNDQLHGYLLQDSLTTPSLALYISAYIPLTHHCVYHTIRKKEVPPQTCALLMCLHRLYFNLLH